MLKSGKYVFSIKTSDLQNPVNICLAFKTSDLQNPVNICLALKTYKIR
jgi:hypothetical protein